MTPDAWATDDAGCHWPDGQVGCYSGGDAHYCPRCNAALPPPVDLLADAIEELMVAVAERDEARSSAARAEKRVSELESEVRESEEYDEREGEKRRAIYAAVKSDADKLLRDALGADLCSRLWGPELEALGAVVDGVLIRAQAAEISLATAAARVDTAERNLADLLAAVWTLLFAHDAMLATLGVPVPVAKAIPGASDAASEAQQVALSALRAVADRVGGCT